MGGKRPQDFPTAIAFASRSIPFFPSEKILASIFCQEMFYSLMIILQFFDMWDLEKNRIVEHDPKCKYWGFFYTFYCKVSRHKLNKSQTLPLD